MSQINLRLRKKLIYSPENFFWYQDIDLLKKDAEQDAEKFDTSQTASYLVIGKPSAGKTHLALTLLDKYRTNRIDAELIVSLNELESIISRNSIPKVIIFDAFDNYLKNYKDRSNNQELASKLITSFDSCKSQQIRLIILSEKKPSFKDPALSSRLNEMVQIQIGKVTIQEQKGMLEMIARQRGYKLPPALLEYISKRVPREISEIIDFFNRLEYVQAESNLKVNRELIAKIV